MLNDGCDPDMSPFFSRPFFLAWHKLYILSKPISISFSKAYNHKEMQYSINYFDVLIKGIIRCLIPVLG